MHDFADPGAVVDATEHCAAGFAAAFGQAPRRHRSGIGGLTEPMVATLDRLGITVDLSMERSRGDLTEAVTGIDASPG